ncbi:MAG: hypothetical protein JW875_02545 [Spirochaetales bacterium]|nr:hypothetical protein [Spirochaetales bacterium]
MKKSYFFLLGAFLISVLFLGGLAGCALDLDPAPSGKATVSLTMASLPYTATASQGSSRAVVQGSGYLYIRPLGGPAGTGPKGYLGPYTITPKDASQGGTAEFSTTDIPAGVYDGLALLYSANKIDDLEVTLGGAKTTFANVFGLSDAQFLAAFEAEDSSGIKVVSRALGGQASGAILKNVTIQAGKKNPLAAVLEPFTPYVYNVLSGGYSFTPSAPGSQRVFVRVQGLALLLSAYTGTVDIQFSLNNTSSSSITFNHAAAYGPTGAFITGAHSVSSTVAAGASTTLTARWGGTDAVYLYLDYSGSSLAISATATTVNPSEAISVTVNNLPVNVMGQELMVFAIPMGAEQTLFTGDYESVAVGMGLISGSSITVQLYGEDAEEEYSFMWKPSSPIRAGIILMTESGILAGPGSTMDAIMPLYIGTFSGGSSHTVDAGNAEMVSLIPTIEISGQMDMDEYYFKIPNAKMYFVTDPNYTHWGEPLSDSHPMVVGMASFDSGEYSEIPWAGWIKSDYPTDGVYLVIVTEKYGQQIPYVSLNKYNPQNTTNYAFVSDTFKPAITFAVVNSLPNQPSIGEPVTVKVQIEGTNQARGTGIMLENPDPGVQYGAVVPLILEGEIDPWEYEPDTEVNIIIDYYDENYQSQTEELSSVWTPFFSAFWVITES